ncbi:MAG: bifunctional phosphopantothenoylcysteine decarboxylase/phosphopantothenate--cysteine ligase CoaBC [Lachnospiraceae bacterium]|nr:bifunctional phosphopantothenoylcysteine decarboxylase/phosphopantothenate--cysteine ligase CoaBC [Lachnospiraceae bacterium]
MLEGKTVILGVTGSIAAYKAADLASRLVKQHAEVHVIMTGNAANFIHPITFETLTGRKCLTDTFDRNFEFEVEHVSLAKKADLMVVAPATANVIAKFACGIADDMLTTTFLACTCPVWIAPAMNTRMYENAATQDNIRTLKSRGIEFIEPASGRLACGDVGKGKLEDPSVIADRILHAIAYEKDLLGKKSLVTAGPTRESIDPVRFISNHSTGKMGYAVAKMASMRGADVTLVTGPVAIAPPPAVKVIPVTSAGDLFRAVTGEAYRQDAIIKAAAVADYRPSSVSSEKMKKADDDLSIALERTEDTLQYLGDRKRPGQILCGFAMETSDLDARAAEKLKKKNLDMIVANNVKVEGAGFGTDTNVVTIITKKETVHLEKMSKEMVAMQILDRISGMMQKGKE